MNALLVALLLSGVKLEGSTDSLEVVTTGTSAIDYSATATNGTATAQTTPVTAVGQITSATSTSIIAAPSASNWREVRNVTLYNSGAASNTVTLRVDRSGSKRIRCKASLEPGASLIWDEQGLCHVYASNGSERFSTDTPGFSGISLSFGLTATVTDAVGYSYNFGKDVGTPGAYSLGTPGVNGVVTACDVVGTAGSGGSLSVGSHTLPDPPTGGWFLTRFGLTAAVVGTYELADVVWYNTGLVVTTLTAQAITTPAFPARDINGSSNGDGYNIGLLTTTANTNAAVISNSTVNYTNSAGTPGHTATLFAAVGFQVPATPVIGTLVRFQLQAGDTGVKSIEGITLGTSYGAGALTLFVYRSLAQEGVALANGPSGSLVSRSQLNPGVRVWNNTCFWRQTVGSTATTAPSIYGGVIELMER